MHAIPNTQAEHLEHLLQQSFNELITQITSVNAYSHISNFLPKPNDAKS